MPMRRLLPALLFVLAFAPAAQAATTPKPWPPAGGSGHLFVHYGEEHWNDEDGLTLLPKVVEESRPLQARPGDDVRRQGQRRHRRPAHDVAQHHGRLRPARASRTSPASATTTAWRRPACRPGRAGCSTRRCAASVTNYKSVFAGRPYPFGDAAALQEPQLRPALAPGIRPGGRLHPLLRGLREARWIFIDNSCWGIRRLRRRSRTRPSPTPRATPASSSSSSAAATEARSKGMTAFAVMHMPTQDPRDQSYTDTTAFNHVMGKGLNPARRPTTTPSRRSPSGPASTASSSATSRASSSTAAVAESRTTSTEERAASCTPRARWAPTTATGTASGSCG